MSETDYTSALVAIDERLAQVAEAVDADRRAYETDIAAQNTRIDEKVALRKRATLALAVAVTVAILLAVAVGVVFKRQQDETNARRVQGRAAVCDGFEAFTNALLGIAPSPDLTDAEKMRRTEAVAAFEADLTERLGPLGCHLTFIDPASTQGSTP